MELIANHLEIFVTALVVLGASAVALICDLLKSNNEHLREVNVELRVRREEEQRWTQMLLNAASASAGIAAVAEEIQPGASFTEARMLAREFMGRAAERARAGQSVECPVVATPPLAQPASAVAQSPVHTDSVVTPTGVRRMNWDALLSSTRKQSSEPVTVEMEIEPAEAAAPKQRMAELIPFETLQNQAGELAIREGFHEGMMIARILKGQKAVRGLVMVITLNNFESRREAAGELGTDALVGSVTDHIRSILRPGDFACRSGHDEFLMICPAERGAAAQRRLGEIAGSLEDFQLRSAGTPVILFSWGGVEAKGEALVDVLAAASERMREARRTHRSLPLEAPSRRKAV